MTCLLCKPLCAPEAECLPPIENDLKFVLAVTLFLCHKLSIILSAHVCDHLTPPPHPLFPSFVNLVSLHLALCPNFQHDNDIVVERLAVLCLLHRFQPTQEEKEMYRNYKEDKSLLQTADTFLLKVQ